MSVEQNLFFAFDLSKKKEEEEEEEMIFLPKEFQ